MSMCRAEAWSRPREQGGRGTWSRAQPQTGQESPSPLSMVLIRRGRLMLTLDQEVWPRHRRWAVMIRFWWEDRFASLKGSPWSLIRWTTIRG
jgi:hypothetical protein